MQRMCNLKSSHFQLFFIITAIFFLCNLNTLAVQPYEPDITDPLLEAWRWQHFPELDGRGFLCMEEAPDGKIWFGLTNGVMTYDGINWTDYTATEDAPKSSIKTICPTKDGSVYVGSESEMTRFADEKWQLIFPPNDKLGGIVNKITQDSNEAIWAGISYGMLRIENAKSVFYTSSATKTGLQQLMPDMQVVAVPDKFTNHMRWLYGPGILQIGGVVTAIAETGTAKKTELKVGDRIVDIKAVSGDCIISWGYISNNLQSIDSNAVSDFVAGELVGKPDSVFELTVQKPNQTEPIKLVLGCVYMEETYPVFEVYEVYQDSRKGMWFGLGCGSIIYQNNYSQNRLDFSDWRFCNEEDNVEKLICPKITESRDGRIWIGSLVKAAGLKVFDPVDSKWTSLRLADIGGDDECGSIIQTNDGAIWVGGLGVINTFKNDKWHIYKYPQVPIVVAVLQFLQTRSGDVWIGGWQNEVVRLSYSYNQWITYKDLNFQCETKDKVLWFISSDGSVVSKNGEIWSRYGVEDGLIEIPVVLKAASNGTLWAAGSNKGVAATAFFAEGKWFKQLHQDLSWGIDYRSILELSDGSLLFGSGTEVSGDGGFVKVRVSQSGNKIWQHIKPLLVPSHICSAAQTSDNTLWFGGLELSRFDGEKTTNKNIPEELKMMWIDFVYCTPTDWLWVSKGGVGLFCYDQKVWRKYTVNNGLASNVVSSMLYYDDAVLAATDKGISRFDSRQWTTYVFPDNFKISREAGTLGTSSDGALWISIATRQWNKRGLTGEIFNKNNLPSFQTTRYVPDRNSPETKITVSTQRIDNAGHATFIWEGADYWENTLDDQLQFSSRLDGQEWSPFTSGRHKTYFELDCGKHKFEVKTRDRDFNVDATPASVEFTVRAPVWRQPWFVVLIISMLSTIIILIIRLVKIREERIKNELQLAQIEAEKVHEVAMMKLNFFTNISHEFRTPLTLILGPLEKIVAKSKASKQLQLAYQNAKRLLRLVNQLLDFRKLESDQLKLEPTKEDIVKFTKNIVNTFVETADDKRIRVKFSANKDYLQVWFDPDKLEKIIYNLLSNALKFTPKGGLISVEVNLCNVKAKTQDSDYAEIIVEDSGMGISAEHIERIFERFYQVERTGVAAGTGIGLALTRELVELHSGEIFAVSPVCESQDKDAKTGTRFVVRLPVEKQQNADEIAFAEKNEDAKQFSADFAEETDESKIPIVLIVEDNADVRLFIKDEIGSEYKIIEAQDGVDGLEKAIETIPDLIISDVMMPNMDGIQLCEKLKTDERTSHIPIILLTARSSEEHKIGGFETGADDYITKPFSVSVLTARIHNLLESRRKLRERFSKELYWKGQDLEFGLSSVDKRFLQKAIGIVEKNISDSNFGARILADELGMSRAQLYRKIKSVTDQTVNSFIRSLRLQRAAKLLLGQKLTISEVGCEVGLFEPANFTAYFRRQFGQSPTEYIAKNFGKTNP